MLKADTSQILTLNFEPKVVKKRLPPWNFDLQGVIFNDFSTFRRIIYKFLNVCPFDYTAIMVSGKVERS